MTQPAAGRRLEPDARREQILERATELFGTRPYDAVSTTELARAAGVARGLVNHYFGTKRELYLAVVRRLLALPADPAPGVAEGPLPSRVAAAVVWFLDSVQRHGATFVAVTAGVGADPEVGRLVAAADDAAARAVLSMADLPVDRPEQVAVVRAYGALARAAVAEWITARTLTREQVARLLVDTLLTIITDVLPTVGGERTEES